MQALGIPQQSANDRSVERQLLHRFAARVITTTPNDLGGLTAQTLYDLEFVSRLCKEAGASNKAIVQRTESVSRWPR